ncbi:MAG: sugar transferase [Ignavibacteria bacterium]|nr:sugar transferase [Ignavibacteria bacterium]MBK7253564.1 sugar transferase [Ignavibacteria bacterium]MBK8382452.1 sugar transferase [Ignavibacteria bacterium]MBK9404309.1 sugar transferase [Ignavibacteria bacterium]
MLKRSFDIFFSFFGLIILSPLFLLIFVMVKTDSKGPVIYKQTRVGKNGKDFAVLKFRSMKQDSDSKGLLTVGGKDPRITKTGYFIRKYKLDELPQLINVLKGDMSFVGPRPEVRKYVLLYDEVQKKVLDVNPGITDVASIKYRNENEMLEGSDDPESFYIKEIMPVKLKMNLEYINDRSFFKDIKVILNTLKTVFT